MRMQRLFFLLPVCGALALVGVGWGANAAGQEAPETASIAAACAECHPDRVEAFAANPHSALDSPQWLAQGQGYEGSCTACHGDGTRHMEEGGAESIFGFGEGELASVERQQCLGCHGDTHPRFEASPHAAAGMACTDCHSIHSPAPRAAALLKTAHSDRGDMLPEGSASATCARCHGEVFSQFSFNERHRLQEGILDCTSCHNPHAPAQRLLLGGFKREACIDCHTDKGGPFVFEHGASKVEGCVACHVPHGTPNRHLLKFQAAAELCFSCHAAVPGFHARFTLETVCTNCHSSIHGSNFDPFFLK